MKKRVDYERLNRLERELGYPISHPMVIKRSRRRVNKKVVSITATALVAVVALVSMASSIFLSSNNTQTGSITPPWERADFISYTCAASHYAGATSSGAANGTSWANKWALTGVNWTTVGSGTSGGNSCLYIDGGSTSVTYSTDLEVAADGTDNSHRVVVLSGQDSGHDGKALFPNHHVSADNSSFVTIDGEGSDASTQHFVSTNSSIGGRSTTDLVERYVEGNDSALDVLFGQAGGLYQHLYLWNIKNPDTQAGAAAQFAPQNNPNAYDQTILEDSHIMVNNKDNGTSGCGADGVQGSPGVTVRYNLIEGDPTLGGDTCGQHQDLIQSQASWFSAYGNVLKDGADSGGLDYDCFNGTTPNHIRFFNNIVIHARGGDSVRFYTSSGACTSFDHIEIDNNLFVDSNDFATAVVAFTAGGSATITNSEMKNNVFYNSLNGHTSINTSSSSGWVAADFNVDYNNISGGSGGITLDGSSYSQTHPSTCTPSFVDYIQDTAVLALADTWYTFGPPDYHISGSDSCLTNGGTSLFTLFTTDADGLSRPNSSPWDLGPYIKS